MSETEKILFGLCIGGALGNIAYVAVGFLFEWWRDRKEEKPDE